MKTQWMSHTDFSSIEEYFKCYLFITTIPLDRIVSKTDQVWNRMASSFPICTFYRFFPSESGWEYPETYHPSHGGFYTLNNNALGILDDPDLEYKTETFSLYPPIPKVLVDLYDKHKNDVV